LQAKPRAVALRLGSHSIMDEVDEAVPVGTTSELEILLDDLVVGIWWTRFCRYSITLSRRSRLPLLPGPVTAIA